MRENIGNGYQHVLGVDSNDTLKAFWIEIPNPIGLDHILFMVGVFLLAPRFAPIFWQLAALTLGHALTVTLGIFGLVTIPPEIIEPLIAALIIYVALENLFMASLGSWRPVVVFGFGLLHGLGFANALEAFGTSEAQFIPTLLGFNIGVGLAEITIVAVCILLVGFWLGQRSWYRWAVTIPCSIVVAGVAAYWFYERTILV